MSSLVLRYYARRLAFFLLGVGTRGCAYIGVVVHCIDIGVLEDICLHRVLGWSYHHNMVSEVKQKEA